MKEYILKVPKGPNGEPLRFFKANLENNVAKAIDQLSGICTGILADGVVNVSEAKFFADWVEKYAQFEPVWPFTDILARVRRIFADGVCDTEELTEIKLLMQSLCGVKENAQSEEVYSSTLPVDSPLPDPINFKDRNFVITGRFAFGTRLKVFESILWAGGTAGDSFPTQQTHYLVIGTFASRDWYNTNYGRKIERAVELRKSGTGISIISEEHWRKFITPL